MPRGHLKYASWVLNILDGTRNGSYKVNFDIDEPTVTPLAVKCQSSKFLLSMLGRTRICFEIYEAMEHIQQLTGIVLENILNGFLVATMFYPNRFPITFTI